MNTTIDGSRGCHPKNNNITLLLYLDFFNHDDYARGMFNHFWIFPCYDDVVVVVEAAEQNTSY